jgi:hypothetical protein
VWRRRRRREKNGKIRNHDVRRISREKIYIYIIYTPNLGLAIAVFDREKGAGPL